MCVTANENNTTSITEHWHPPSWGNYVGFADQDLMSFGLLTWGHLFVSGYYHATQAVEKYLKALYWSINDPHGQVTYESLKNELNSHDLANLAQKCACKYPFYGQADVNRALQKYTEYDQATRYPWVQMKLSNGFSSTEVKEFERLIHRLRNDIPIVIDDYPLGMAVRRSHQKHPEIKLQDWRTTQLQIAVSALRQKFTDVDGLVRW